MMNCLKTKTPQVASGVWAVAVTPFKKNLAIDWEAYTDLIEFYIDAGVHGIFTACASSEVFELTPEECVRLTREAVALAAGRVEVVAGCLMTDGDQVCLAQTLRLADAGADAVVYSPSTLVPIDNDDSALWRRLEWLMSTTGDLPLGTYECPLPYRRTLGEDMFGRLARSGRFVFHKDTTCDIDQIQTKLRVAEGTPMKIFNANVQTFVASVRAGAAGYCGVGTNFYPDLLVGLWNRTRDSLPIDQAVESFVISSEEVFGDDYLPSAKRALARQGVGLGRYCRQVDRSRRGKNMTNLDGMLARLLALRAIQPVTQDSSPPAVRSVS